MHDALGITLIVLFFGLCVLYVSVLDRIGRTP